MRKYKHLFIPDRLPRTDFCIFEKQKNYCSKSYCAGVNLDCENCLFDKTNIENFKSWYMAKNKSKDKRV